MTSQAHRYHLKILVSRLIPIRTIIATLIFVCIGIGSPINALTVSKAQTQDIIESLELGKSIERKLEGGQAHSYGLTLTTNQYVYVVVEQKGIDVVVILFGPDGNKLSEIDSPNGMKGPEP